METTIVTCSSLKVDYARNVAVFSGNVYVRDTGGKMWTDKMKVYFDPESHEIKTMVSTGKKVLINTGKKQSRSRKAVYTASDGRIVLTGKPRVYHGKNLYGAERITIFKGSDKIIFEPKASLIIKREKLEGMVDDTL